MRTKTFILLIGLIIAILVFGLIGFQIYMKQPYTPGVKNLAKSNIAVLYCTYGEGIKDIIDIVGNKVKADVIEIKPAVAYPTNKEDFDKRIKGENEGLSSIILDNQDINIRKYKLIIFATPIIQNKPCPVIQKLIIDNEGRFKNKAVSALVLFNDGTDNTKDTMDFFYYKLHDANQKPNFLTLKRGKEQLNYEIKLWFDQMEFKREELR